MDFCTSRDLGGGVGAKSFHDSSAFGCVCWRLREGKRKQIKEELGSIHPKRQLSSRIHLQTIKGSPYWRAGV